MFLRDRSLIHYRHLHSFTSPSWSRKQVLVPKLAAPSRLPSSSPASNHFLFLFERIIFSSASSRLLLPLLHVVVAFMLSLLARTATTASPILLILAVAEWTSSADFSPQNQHQLFIFDLSFLLLWVPSSLFVSAYYCSLLLLLNNSVRVTVVAEPSLLLPISTTNSTSSRHLLAAWNRAQLRPSSSSRNSFLSCRELLQG